MSPKKSFDVNGAADENAGIFGLPYTFEESNLVLIPVPWDATTSYRAGTHRGPDAIFDASFQLDLFHPALKDPYDMGIHLLETSDFVVKWNRDARALAEPIIEAGGRIEDSPDLQKNLRQVNELSAHVNRYVHEEAVRILKARKIPVVVGGDHASPLGLMKALSEGHGEFGVLHFDAHSDTRIHYEGFTYSHASIFYNALTEIPAITQLTQVGIRDFCAQEARWIADRPTRCRMISDRDLAQARFQGASWDSICTDIVETLPSKVYLSFDIDALEPSFCPNTGTPVPGGLSYNEAVYLIEKVARSGRKIIGFDLCEVAPDPTGSSEWDANVGMRLLYQMCAWTGFSQGLVTAH